MSKDEVKFTEMKHGDKEDYELLANFEDKFIEGTADRIVRVLESLDNSLGGYKVSRLEHSLQTASRALREQASEEMVVASLLHDIGDEIAPLNHSELAAAVLKPFVSEKTSFDPNYDTIPLKEFVPMVQRIFNRTPYRNL